MACIPTVEAPILYTNISFTSTQGEILLCIFALECRISFLVR